MLQNEYPENVLVQPSHITQEAFHPIFTALQESLYQEINNSMLDPEAYKTKLFAFGGFYILGFDIQWSAIYSEKYTRISLPTYPFEKQRYWLPQATEKKSSPPENLIHQMTNSQNVLPVQPTPAPRDENLKEILRKNLLLDVANLLKIPVPQLSEEKALSELGFDSISFKELAIKLEKKYQIELNPAIFFTHNSIKALSNYLVDINFEKINAFFINRNNSINSNNLISSNHSTSSKQLP